MPKIMIAEDDETMRSLLQTLLEYEGYEVAYVNHLEGMDLVLGTIRKVKPDLLLLDVYMNRIDGFGLMRRIHGDEDLKSVRVLLSSGRELSSEALGEGADGFILKPYMPDDLINQIQNILGK